MITGAHKLMMAMLRPPVLPLAATLTEATVAGLRSGSGVTTSNSVSCIATGGSGTGYTYTWTYVSGDSNILPDSGSAATTTFSKNLTAPDLTTAVYKCVVNDSLGNGPVDSATNVSIELEAT